MWKGAGEEAGLLGRVRVAAPCPASWAEMEGDERVRFCRLCRLNVYNLSEMTRAEAEALLARTEGRLCARLYRRADGTVITKDCPVGLRALRRRVRRAAAALFAAVASLWTVATGQAATRAGQRKDEPAAVACQGGGQLKIRRKAAPDGEKPTLSGVALDPAGAVIPGVEVTLSNEATKESVRAVTNEEGAFSFPLPAAGTYTLRLEATAFATQEVKGLAAAAGESVSVESVMALSDVTVMVGVIAVDYPELNGNGKTAIDGKAVRRLPPF